MFCHVKRQQQTAEIDRLDQKTKESLTEDEFISIQEIHRRSYNKELISSKERQLRKYERLVSKQQ